MLLFKMQKCLWHTSVITASQKILSEEIWDFSHSPWPIQLVHSGHSVPHRLWSTKYTFNIWRFNMKNIFNILHLGKKSPSMLAATRWQLDQCEEDWMEQGLPGMALTPCDSGLGGTFVGRLRSGQVQVKMKWNWLPNTENFWPPRNAHLCPT